MSAAVIRPFQRSDREQVTRLVNAHVEAVMPGVSVSVNAVMSQLEREPGEAIVDPWVLERSTLVALERERVVAAALLLRYAAGERVGESYRNFGEIRWLVFGPGSERAADELMAACGAQFARWGVARSGADMSLPCPCCYGVPDAWPHLRELLVRHGFRHEGHTETILVAAVAALPSALPAPLDGLTVQRELGGPAVAGPRLGARLAGELIGFVDLSSDLTGGGALSRLAGWAEIDSLWVDEPYRRQHVGTWLMAQAAEWLRLGHADRLVAYCAAGQHDVRAFASRVGFGVLAHTERGWYAP